MGNLSNVIVYQYSDDRMIHLRHKQEPAALSQTTRHRINILKVFITPIYTEYKLLSRYPMSMPASASRYDIMPTTYVTVFTVDK